MLHLLYFIAFTVLAVLAVSNMIRNVVTLGTQSRAPVRRSSASSQSVSHPELLDDSGDVIDEPLLVMRSISVKDARERLDAIYDLSSNGAPANGSSFNGDDAANSDS